MPTLFEEEILTKDIILINTRPYHLLTNGRLERFHRTIYEEIFHYYSLKEYVDYSMRRGGIYHWTLTTMKPRLRYSGTKKQPIQSGKVI